MKTTTILLLFISLTLAACQAIPDTPTPPASPPALVTESPSPAPSPSPSPVPSPTSAPEPSSTPTPAQTATPVTASPPPAPVKGGTVILGLVGRPQTLNPIVEHNAALRELRPLLFDTLLRVDPETAELKPGLAQSWEFSPDGKQVIFQLPANLKWSNGTSFTAADVAESLQATQHPALRSFSEISAPDDQTLALTFTSIDCGAVTHVAQLPLLPASQILEPIPMGSGPFMVIDRSENQRRLTLGQNPSYHGTSPFLDGLSVRFIGEDSLDLAVSEGQFDAIGALPAGLTWSNSGSFTDIVYSAPQMIYISINYAPRNELPLSPQIRQALPLALDRQAILTEVWAGDGQLLPASLLPGHWAANNALSPPPFDPDLARELLAEAGLSDSDGDGWLDQNGERLELGIRLNGKNALHQQLGWLAGSYYRDLGLYARAESVPPDSLIDDLFTHDFTLAIFSWLVLPDPDQRVYWHSTENIEGEGLNLTSYNNSQLDELLNEGVAVSGCRTEARTNSYSQVQDILSQDRPVDFLLAPNRHVLISSRLQGLAPGPFSPFTWNITEWGFQE